jgi:hypothetical protein
MYMEVLNFVSENLWWHDSIHFLNVLFIDTIIYRDYMVSVLYVWINVQH